MTAPADLRSCWKTAAAVAALLALHAVLALWAVSNESVTADEILHVTGGYFYNKYGDYRIQPENGNLPQRWAALPAWLLDAPPPPMAGNIYWQHANATVVGHQFFYETGHDHWPMLMAGRALMMIFSLGTGGLIFCWSRRLFGLGAGFVSLTFYVLCPNVLAHAPLATSDMASVFFLLAGVGAFWRHLAAPTWRNGAVSAGVFGLACVAKYSAVLLPPMMLILLAWHIGRTPGPDRTRWWRLAPLSVAGHVAGALIVIWAFYGFRYSGFAPDVPPPADGQYLTAWENVLPYIGFHRYLVDFCRNWHLLPEAFLFGYAWVVQSAQARSSFLAGDYSIYGWTSFFPLAFLWKTPLALLAALAAGLIAWIRRWRTVRLDTVAPLLVLFAVYWAFSLTSKLNIGHRHILPTYPVLFILVGGLAAPGVLAGRWRIALPALLLLGQLGATLRVAPHYLSFFNSFAGGPANGWRLLVDSSLDWGQNLPELKKWLAANRRPGEPLFLSYFGTGEPDYYQIKAVRLPMVPTFDRVRPWYWCEPGLYAISATMLQQVYLPYHGPWTAENERQYQQMRRLDPQFRALKAAPDGHPELMREVSPEQWTRSWSLYEQLRFARLCHYLRARRPDAMIGYSILIFRLSQAEIDSALNGPVSELAAAIERAGQTPPPVPD